MSESVLRTPSASRIGAPLKLLGDQTLSRLAARGSQPAFEAIFARYHQPLYRYARSILGDPEDSRDAVSATMVKLLDALPGEGRRIELRPWLFRVAHNEAISIVRRRREQPLASAPEPADGSDPDDRIRAAGIISDLALLGEKQRSAVIMRELNGLSHAEIAEALGISAEAAKQAVYEGRTALQEIERGREMSCENVRELISARDRRRLRGRSVRAHLKACGGCRAFESAIKRRRRELAAIAPMPAAVSEGLLRDLLGSGAGPGGGLGLLGLAGSLQALGGGTVAKLAASAVAISAAGVAVSTDVLSSEEPARAKVSGPPGIDTTIDGARSNQAAAAAAGASSARADAGEGGGRARSDGKRAQGKGAGKSEGRGDNAPGASNAGHGSANAQGPPSHAPGPPATPPGPESGLENAAANKPQDPGSGGGHSQAPAIPPGTEKMPELPQLPQVPGGGAGAQPAPPGKG